MTVQTYCMVNPNKVCDNICKWDENSDTWQPPDGYVMLVQATTPSKIWIGNNLVQRMGSGGINFTWDGTFLIEPKPEFQTNMTTEAAPNQPNSTGTQTL